MHVTGPGDELVTPGAGDPHAAAWRPADLAYAQLARQVRGLRVSRYFARQGTYKVESRQAHAEMTGALARLAQELATRGYIATVIARGGLWRPSLVVRNPAVAIRTSEIVAESGWFWWPIAHRLCPVTEPARAAQMIISVLRLGAERDG
jgi:hypothetical protein